jgi:hypothetical protein
MERGSELRLLQFEHTFTKYLFIRHPAKPLWFKICFPGPGSSGLSTSDLTVPGSAPLSEIEPHITRFLES